MKTPISMDMKVVNQRPSVAAVQNSNADFPSYMHSVTEQFNSFQQNNEKQTSFAERSNQPSVKNTQNFLKTNLKKSQILVVEDNEMLQTSARLFLEGMNCIVVIAANGKQAVELATAKEAKLFNIIFMDIQLDDGINGIETAAKIRALKSINKETPIVALTSLNDSRTRRQCIDAGMNDFYVKPAYAADFKKILTKFQVSFLEKEKI